jgi:hypothetical protein
VGYWKRHSTSTGKNRENTETYMHGNNFMNGTPIAQQLREKD